MLNTQFFVGNDLRQMFLVDQCHCNNQCSNEWQITAVAAGTFKAPANSYFDSEFDQDAYLIARDSH